MREIQNSRDTLASFRDPAGFLFRRDGLLYRQVNLSCKNNYDCLIESGLYRELVEAGLLVAHEEIGLNPPQPEKAYKIIKPEMVPFISYPYEWCFSQLKDAALLTLEVQKHALRFGMSLSDSSAYNIQFRDGRPVFIDTLSFEKCQPGQPWVAYRQFCQHFIAPLALMACRDVRLNGLLRIYLDGIPLDLASVLLPFYTRFNISLLTHIYLHSRSQRYFADKPADIKRYKMNRIGFLGLIDSLESAVKQLRWQPWGTEWAKYYQDTNYSAEAFQHKKQVLSEMLDNIKPASVWDLGSNIGTFSRIAGAKGIRTLSFDNDPACVEQHYLQCKSEHGNNILPLLVDLTNPSPAIGWANEERMSFMERGPADAALALALVHHLAISNNIPLGRIAGFFSGICRWLIIEFVPRTDSQVQRLLASREDIFSEYTQQAFENEFGKYFAIIDSTAIADSRRILYLMRRR